MKRIVLEDYPISNLPEELRERLDGSMPVTLVIEQHAFAQAEGEAGHPSEQETERLPLTRIMEAMQDRRVCSDDPVKRIRALRAEWDWREALHDRIRAGHAD